MRDLSVSHIQGTCVIITAHRASALIKILLNVFHFQADEFFRPAGAECRAVKAGHKIRARN
jgi:hypothetical protein